MTTWKPITPDICDGTEVIVCVGDETPDAVVGEAYFYTGDEAVNGWYWANLRPTDPNVSPISPALWTPLPSPPHEF